MQARNAKIRQFKAKSGAKTNILKARDSGIRRETPTSWLRKQELVESKKVKTEKEKKEIPHAHPKWDATVYLGQIGGEALILAISAIMDYLQV